MAIFRLGEVDMGARTKDKTDGGGWGARLATRADVAELRVEIAKSGARTARWMVGSVSVGVAVMTIMYRLLG